jgi:ketosteroid isomerase-like protein
MTTPDEELIKVTVLDYFEGWFTGDTERMDRALHPDLVKRWPGTDQAASLGITTKERMLELTAAGEGKGDAGDGTIEVTINDVREDIATVTVRAGVYHEYLHLVRARDGWKIANALWRFADPPQ